MWDKMFLPDSFGINKNDHLYTKQEVLNMMDKRFKKQYSDETRENVSKEVEQIMRLIKTLNSKLGKLGPKSVNTKSLREVYKILLDIYDINVDEESGKIKYPFVDNSRYLGQEINIKPILRFNDFLSR